MMQTPYDSALRVQRRALDAIRLSLLAELAREQAVDAERTALDRRMADEAGVAASDWEVMGHPYVAYQRARRRRLEHDQRGIDASLSRLRGAAMEACGLMQAISGAATGYAAGRIREEAGTEQAHADDFAGARMAARRPPAPAGR